MAKAVDYNPDSSLEDLFLKSIKVKRKLYDPSMDKKDVIWGRRNLKALKEQSQITPCSVLWQSLNTGAKTRWSNAGAECGLTGYQLFVKDTTYRLENNIRGLASPNVYHQFKVTKWVLGNGAPEFYLYHEVPDEYFVFVKNTGQKNAYTLTQITVSGAPPFTLAFDYNFDIEPTDVIDWFDVYIVAYGTKNGSPASDWDLFNLDYGQGWQKFEQELNFDLDDISSFYFVISGNPFKGTVYVDNVKCLIDETNFAHDPDCEFSDEVYFYYDDSWYYPWNLDWGGTYVSFDSVYL